jgi:hypothetical protein
VHKYVTLKEDQLEVYNAHLYKCVRNGALKEEPSRMVHIPGFNTHQLSARFWRPESLFVYNSCCNVHLCKCDRVAHSKKSACIPEVSHTLD